MGRLQVHPVRYIEHEDGGGSRARPGYVVEKSPPRGFPLFYNPPAPFFFFLLSFSPNVTRNGGGRHHLPGANFISRIQLDRFAFRTRSPPFPDGCRWVTRVLDIERVMRIPEPYFYFLPNKSITHIISRSHPVSQCPTLSNYSILEIKEIIAFFKRFFFGLNYDSSVVQN